MKINKAVITAAGRNQQTLPLQTLIDSDGTEKSVLKIIVEEALRAGIEEICLVVQAGDEKAYAQVAGEHAGRLHFVQQKKPLGYGHAIYCAKEFIGNDAFLHLVGDHLYVNRSQKGCAQQLVEVATSNSCAVSAVQAIRETLLPFYGAVGGMPVQGKQDLYKIDEVVEKPTPTQAEQHLVVPGLRAGHYLCFFGMHVLTPTVIDILRKFIKKSDEQKIHLSPALAELAKKEQYLALQLHDWRYDVGVKYGLMTAQIALAMNGKDRDEVLATLLELLATRELKVLGR
ncbi:MAG: UTP--glucose-1-phosphate uridylyltransferase [Deferribacteres bacterium]|nr:UTP--glucose-1-phosphate uridylyltransferase [candidate division KSB1 bacterium]MCB9502212.1 UTP--glucose-1-phosphate uridylyltransferase [Deferribacteres bacterium]